MGANGKPQEPKHMKPPAARHHIRAWRIHRGLTQVALAARSGLSRASICQIENGDQNYKQDTIEALAAALRCTPADLLGRDPDDETHIGTLWQKIPPDQRWLAARVITAFAYAKPRSEP